jgi:hypothetical protein
MSTPDDVPAAGDDVADRLVVDFADLEVSPVPLLPSEGEEDDETPEEAE